MYIGKDWTEHWGRYDFFFFLLCCWNLSKNTQRGISNTQIVRVSSAYILCSRTAVSQNVTFRSWVLLGCFLTAPQHSAASLSARGSYSKTQTGLSSSSRFPSFLSVNCWNSARASPRSAICECEAGERLMAAVNRCGEGWCSRSTAVWLHSASPCKPRPARTQESGRHGASEAASCDAGCKYLTSASRQEQTGGSDVHPLENLTLLFPVCPTVWLDLSALMFLFAWATSSGIYEKKKKIGGMFLESRNL